MALLHVPDQAHVVNELDLPIEGALTASNGRRQCNG